MVPVVTAAEMRALDKATIEEVGLPGVVLMENAGRAVAAAAVDLLAKAQSPKPKAQLAQLPHIAIISGSGGNGGDGFVAARVLRELGFDAVVYLAVARDQVAGDARTHLGILERAGGVVRAIDTPERLGELGDAIAGAELAIDALFGIGLARPITGHLADVVSTINHAGQRLAVDIPSGLDADSGRVLGIAVTAHRTITLAARKIALASAPGFAHAGTVEVADIGIPGRLVAASAVCAGLVELADVATWLPRATALDHKGRRGHVVVIGGMPGMRGAGRLTSLAALRAGAGLVTLASAGEVSADDSVMTRSLETNLGELLGGKHAIAIGPGLGQSELAAGWVGEVLAAGVPAVLDADALNLIAGVGQGPARSGPLAHHANGLAAVAKAAGPIVLTPHPGEAARLLGQTVVEVEADRLGAARALAARTHAVVVLKGARTIVCDGTLGDELCTINWTGGPELATGGSGDVLTGVIAALIAQGVAPAAAARAGVYVHGCAGDELAIRHGARGVVSSDLPPAIAGVISRLG
jgi:NAD(P)H-hydrate epimerase